MAKDIKSKLADANEFKQMFELFKAEMNKATQTTATTEDIIEIDYDPEIKNRLISEAPLLRFLEEKGRVQTSSSSTIGWRNKENKNTSKVIGETDNLPLYGGKDWSKEVEHMKTFVYPISVSMMAQMGNTVVDLINDDRQDGYADISAHKDKLFLLGDSGSNPDEYDGIHKLAENKEDLQDDVITMDIVDDMIDQVIAKGGNPDAIVTTARVARQLTREQQEKNYHIDKSEFVPGGWVRSYYTPNGDVPVITDRNLVTFNSDNSVDKTSLDTLAVIDSKAVINKTLLPVSEFNLAMTKLTTDSVLATFTAFGIPEPQKLGVIEGIGVGSP